MRQESIEKITSKIDYERERHTYPEGFPSLPEIPGERYISDEFFELEMEHFWMKTWLCAIRAEEVPTPGCFKLYRRFGKPLVIVRGKDNQIRAFYNTCRHRGAPLVREEEGRRPVLTCGYHSWGYDLTGKLLNVPEEHDFGGFNKCERGLIPVSCDTWGGWVFINFDANAAPLMDSLAAIDEELASMNMASLRIKGRLKYHIKCNWKAAYDAFLEAYHVPSIHPETVALLLDGRSAAIGVYAGGHSHMAMPKKFNTEGGTWGTDGAAYDIPTVPKIFRQNNVAFGIFPNIAAPFDSAGFPFVQFWPDGKSGCECELIIVGAGDEAETQENSEYWKTFFENYDKIMDEDVQFLEGIQESLESGAFTGMKLCYQERRIYWVHEEIDRRIGVERIPEHLRVTQLLSSHVEQ